MTSRKASSVAVGAAIISGGMLLSRILGLLRENMMFGTFGDTNISGAYNLAFVVPDLFYNLLAGGALSAAFIPVFASYLSKNQDAEAHNTGSTIAVLLLTATSIFAALGIVFAGPLINLLQYLQPPDKQLDAESIKLTISLTRIMCIMVIFTAQSGHLTGILNSYKHFLTPAVVWLVYNLSIMLGIGVFSKLSIFGGSPTNPNIHGVAYGVVFGAFLMAAIQLPVVIKYGFRFSFALDFAHEGVRKVIKLFGPVMLGLSLSQINLMLLPLVLGSRFGLPAVTDIRAANRLVLLPLGLFAIAISTAAFPKLSQQAALGETSAFKKTLEQAIKLIMLLSIPSAIALFILAEPITYLLWGGGKFGAQGVRASAFVLVFFSLGLIALGLVQVVNRAFYAMHDTATPVYVGIGMVALNIPLALLLGNYSHLDYGSVALATTITTTASTLVLTELLRRRMGGLGGRAILTMVLKVLAASVLMGVVLFVSARYFAPMFLGEKIVPIFRWPAPYIPHSVSDIAALPTVKVPRTLLGIQVGLSMILGTAAYLGMLKLLKVDELAIITDRLMRKVRKTQPPAAV